DHRRVLEEASVQVGAALAVQEVVPRGGGGPAAVRRAAVLRRGGRATRAAAPAAAGDAVLRQEGEFVRLGAAPTVLRAARVAPRPVGARVAGGAARARVVRGPGAARRAIAGAGAMIDVHGLVRAGPAEHVRGDRKSTRLNSSHVKISYA